MMKFLVNYFLSFIFLSFSFGSYCQDTELELYDSPYLNQNRWYNAGELGDMVDPFTGNLKVSHTDLMIPGNGGLDLRIVRFYAAPQDYHTDFSSGKLGMHWRMHFGRLLVNNAQNAFYFETQDGSIESFAFNQQKNFYLSKHRWKLIDRNGSYVIYSPDGTQYIADKSIKINEYYVSQITDSNGNRINISGGFVSGSSGDFNIYEVTTSDGRRLAFDYQNAINPRLVRIRDTVGHREVTYRHSVWSLVGAAISQLTRVTRPDGLSWFFDYHSKNASVGRTALKRLTSPYGASIQFQYSKKVFRRRATPNTVVSRSTLSGSQVTTSTTIYSYYYGSSYDATIVQESPSGVRRVYKHFGYSSIRNGEAWKAGLPFEISIYNGSRLNERTTITYDKIKQSDSPYIVNYGAAAKPTDSVTYAAVVSKHEVTRDGDRYSNIYHYNSRDILLNPTSLRESGPNDSRTIYYQYDINEQKWLINNVSQERIIGIGDIQRRFDSSGNLISENVYGVSTNYSYDSSGNISAIQDANGNIYHYSSYQHGIPRYSRLPEGITINKSVNNYGLVASETDGNGNRSQYYYDGLNRITLIIPPQGNPVNISYSRYGSRITRGSTKLSTSIDGLGHVIQRVKSAPGVSSQTIRYRYDSLGRQTFRSLVNQSSGISSVYDALNRVTRYCHSDGCTSYSYGSGNSITVTDANANRVTRRYQSFSHPDSKAMIAYQSGTQRINISRNKIGLITRISSGNINKHYRYDSNYYLSSIKEPETGTISFYNDNNGNVITKRQQGQTTSYRYDRLNRLKKATYSGNSGTISYSYDKNDNLTLLSRHYNGSNHVNSVYKMYYDTVNRLTKESKQVDGKTYTVSYRYNADDHQASVAYPSGLTLHFHPDHFGRATRVGSIVNNIRYHPDNQISSLHYGNGKVLNQTLDYLQRLNGIAVSGVVQQQISYDNVSNITSIKDNLRNETQRMYYDNLNRLIEDRVNHSDFAEFSYDNLNNIIKKKTVLGTDNYHYSNNRLSRINGASGNQLFSYDNRGNINNDGSHSYRYGTDGSLLTMDDVIYSYDGNQQRIAKTTDGETTYFIYDKDGQLIAEYDGNGELLKEFYHLNGQTVAQKRIKTPIHYLFTDSSESHTANSHTTATEWVTEYLHNDVLGTPIAATDSSGQLLWQSLRRAYGTVANRADKSHYPIGYTGHYEDSESELTYANARYYHASIGRFYSPDPISFRDSDITSFNRYAYADNNPYKYTDPTGELPFLVPVVFIAKEIAAEAFEYATGIPLPTVKNGIKYGGKVLAKKAITEGVEKSLKDGSYKMVSEAAKKQKHLKKQAQELKKLNDNKNTVKVRTSKKQINYDLDGATHRGVSTPHKQYSYPNKNPKGEIFFNKDRRKVDAMKQKDMRTVRKILNNRKNEKK